MFKRREGAAAISGPLYETKLLSLLYFRAIHDKRIAEFHLASNVDDIGVFDDICFKATVEGFSKPLLVFIQAKHRENKKQTLKIDLITYFISYLKIRQHFISTNNDLLFGGAFDETECLFIIYTTTRDGFSNESKVESSFCSILNDLIGTSAGGTVKQPYNQIQDVEFLCKIVIKYHITSLAELIINYITDKVDFLQMLNDENENIILRYHVILAQKVLEISEIQPNGHRIATFRHDFFDNKEEYITLFRDRLFKEILKIRKIGSIDIKNLLSAFIAQPTDAVKLSKLIGTVITYNNGLLEINKQYAEYFRPELNQEYVSRLTIDKAVELAAKEILLSPEWNLRVPAAFGNKDITISKKSRIQYLTLNIISLLDKYKSSKMITIDESLEKGFLRLKGGIAGAIGNIFVRDDNTKLMKITDNKDALGTNARNLYENLNKEIALMNENRSKDKIPDISEYKFCFKGNKFPKLLFEFTEDEENLARDFLNKFLIYCNQADEKEVEEILKDEIALRYQDNQPHYYQIKTDAVFSKYHTAILQWWMQPRESYSLTRESDLFRHSLYNIIEDPLMTSINLIYRSKIQQYKYTFNENAINFLNLQDQHSCTIIVAENSVLTVVKVMQYLKNKIYHVVLDLECIANLPMNDRNALRSELKYTNEAKVLILVCNKVDSTNEMKTLEDIAKAVRYRRTIIITNQTSLQIINTFFPEANCILHDKKLSLIDMSKISQKRILETATAIFQSVEIRLDLLLKGWPMTGPRSAGTAVAASAVADKETGTDSHRIGDEDWNVPGTSQEPMSGPEPDSPPGSASLAPPQTPTPPTPPPPTPLPSTAPPDSTEPRLSTACIRNVCS